MNTIEEQLWNYIDGQCTANEKAEIEAKLAIDSNYQAVYEELLAVNQELNNLEFEEPSLSFTRNVMEQVKLEPRPVTLKTKIDKRIIYSIGAFFAISILGLFGYAISISIEGCYSTISIQRAPISIFVVWYAVIIIII